MHKKGEKQLDNLGPAALFRAGALKQVTPPALVPFNYTNFPLIFFLSLFVYYSNVCNMEGSERTI